LRSLSIIVIARNFPDRLHSCLKSLRGQIRNVELVVVDDGSQPAIRVDERTVRNPLPRGAAAARNLGARSTSGGLLLFVDGDLCLDVGVVENHVALQNTSPCLARADILHVPRLAIANNLLDPFGLPKSTQELCSRVLSHPLDTVREHARADPTYKRMSSIADGCREKRWLSCAGGNLSIHREDFLRIGGFRTDFGTRWGLEDLEFALRASEAGLPIHKVAGHAFHLDHPKASGRADDHESALVDFQALHGITRTRELRDFLSGPK